MMRGNSGYALELFTLMLCLSFGMTLSACGDDDGEVSTGDGGMCQMPYVGPAVPTSAACTSSADLIAAQRTDYVFIPAPQDAGMGDAGAGSEDAGTLPMGLLGDVAAICAQECILASDGPACINACLERTLAGDDGRPSSGCQDCYVTSAFCAIQTCALLCATDALAPACVNCVCGRNASSTDCIGDFELCAGIPATNCDNACLD